jgi:4-amino-4-deoxy-L-arabinose transferase-like glycosyltransferase
VNVPVAAHARRHLLVLVVAGIWLASNLTKPLTIDDAAYYEYARHIAAHPADPYGFTIIWYQTLQPAIEVLAPPVSLYWWAAGVRWFGDYEWAWKLWQFPLVYLFVAAFAAIARRFVREPAASVLPVFIVLSPVFLPGLNLMLDVPALALGLAGFVLFVRASDRNSTIWAALAGLVVGLAMQTKYTAGLVPVTMVLYAVFLGRVRLALVAGSVAAAVFASWEAAMLWRYGQTQFIAGLLEPGGGLGRKWSLIQALITLAGGVGSAWGFLGLAALGVRGRLVAFGMLVSAAAFVAVGWLPDRIPVALPDALATALGRSLVHLNPSLDLCRALGALLIVAVASVVMRLRKGADRGDLFLLGWLALEVAGYLLLNPFVAVRRLMGLAVVVTLVVGRLASRTVASHEQRRLTLAVLGYGVALALVFAVTDRADAIAQREGAARAADVAREQLRGPGARMWYVGHWGFQFYAERAGMEPVVPGSSLLRHGDVLVAAGAPVDAQRVRLSPSGVGVVAQVAVEDHLPWRTIPGYYRGAVPISSRPPGPRLNVTVYRLLEDLVPEAPRVR